MCMTMRSWLRAQRDTRSCANDRAAASQTASALPCSTATPAAAAAYTATATAAAPQFESVLSDGESEAAAAAAAVAPKSEATTALLLAALRDHFLFSALAEANLRACVDRMAPRAFAAGEDLITQARIAASFL
jgi:hypothetical protein